MVNTPQPYAGDTKSSPVIACIIGTIISCILAAGIIIAHFPGPAPMWGSIMWVCIAAVLTIATIVLILRKRPFARKLFFTVAKWVFLYILVLTGMGEYVIVFDGTQGRTACRHDHHTPAVPGQYPDALGLFGRPPREHPELIVIAAVPQVDFQRPSKQGDLMRSP